MTSPVTKAMIESYALMVLVMGTFFVYFCGMVWAFCNPKLSGSEEKEEAEVGGVCAPRPPERLLRCGCARPEAPLCAPEGLTQSTYVNFWEDTDSLLEDCTAVCREDQGINNLTAHSLYWAP